MSSPSEKGRIGLLINVGEREAGTVSGHCRSRFTVYQFPQLVAATALEAWCRKAQVRQA